MLWKALLITTFAVGILEGSKITEEQQNQYLDMIKNFCTANGAANKAEDAQNAVKTFLQCLQEFIDLDTLKGEIEDAKPKGTLDEVFAKYCAISPQLKSCFSNLSTRVGACLPDNQNIVGMVDGANDQLIDFLCYKDGDRLALFIAEGGPDCFRDKSNEIRECANKLKEDFKSTAKKLTVEEQCAKYDELTQCVVKVLEGCPDPTPGNMAESLFKYVRKTSICKK